MNCPYRNNFEKIVAYVRAELPPEEQEAFENHFLGCEQCAHDVLWVEKTTLVMSQHGHYVFAPSAATRSNGMAHYADRVAHEFEKFAWHLGKWRHLPGYAVVVLIASLGFWLFSKIDVQLTPSHLNEGIADKGHEANQFPVPTFKWPGDFPDVNNTELRARLTGLSPSYQSGKFGVVIDSLRAFAGQYPEETQIQLYWGISALHAKRFPEAVEHLSPFLDEAHPPGTALWYLAHAYLQQRDIESAKHALQKLDNLPQNTPYQADAHALFERLP